MFEGDKVRLRAYTREDLPETRSYVNEEGVGDLLRSDILFPFRPEDQEKWYESLDAKSDKEYSFAIESREDGAFLGGCGVVEIRAKDRVGRIGMFLGKEHIGKGYGIDALRVLVAFCFNEINLNKLKLDVFSFNERAVRCYEKAGFKREGVLRQDAYRYGRYHDVIVMGLLRSEWEPGNQPFEV